MSLPLHFLRPAAHGFAIGLLLAVAGCGVSSKPDSAAVVAQPAQGELKTDALVPREAVMADTSMAKRSARPAISAMYAPMPEFPAPGYREDRKSTRLNSSH